MKIAIHIGKNDFSSYWIQYCKQANIPFKLVSAYDSNIIEQIQDCDIFMWHHYQDNYKDVLSAKKILFSLEHAGKKVFPNFRTGWHFDDKVAQKYLLEAIEAPLVPSHVFYDKKVALEWANRTSFPQVFKLKGGASSENVRLVKSKKEAARLIRRAFGCGFVQYNRWGNLKDRFTKYRKGKDTLLGVFKAIIRLFITSRFSKMAGREKGYVYFQEYVPNNKTDFRIKIVNGKCWGFQRRVRTNDFRASGGGDLLFDNSLIPFEMIELAFNVQKKLGLQSTAFDFILLQGKPLIVEMSYGFGVDKDEFNYGYWDSNLIWHNEKFNPFEWMVQDLIDSIEKAN